MEISLLITLNIFGCLIICKQKKVLRKNINFSLWIVLIKIEYFLHE